MSFLVRPSEAVPAPRIDLISPHQQLRLINQYFRDEIAKQTSLISDIAQIIVEYQPDHLAANWYRALDRLKILPREIPHLPPAEIDRMFAKECPEEFFGKKKNGTLYTMGETHTLILIPTEFKTLNHLLNQYLKPFKIEGVDWDRIRGEYGDKPFGPSRWIFLTKDVLKGSRGKSYEKQIEAIHRLSQKMNEKYQMPPLVDVIAAIFLHYIATGENLYPRGKWFFSSDTFTRVCEKSQDGELVVGGSDEKGFEVDFHGVDSRHTGTAALIELNPV